MIGKFCVSIIYVLKRYIQETIIMSFNYKQTPYVFVVSCSEWHLQCYRAMTTMYNLYMSGQPSNV